MRKLVLLALLLGGVVGAYAEPIEFKFIGFFGGQWQNGYPYLILPTQLDPPERPPRDV